MIRCALGGQISLIIDLMMIYFYLENAKKAYLSGAAFFGMALGQFLVVIDQSD